jgi:hypothetical protein
MRRPSVPSFLLLAWMAAACGSNASGQGTFPIGDDGGGSGSSSGAGSGSGSGGGAGQDAASGSSSGSGPVDASVDSGGGSGSGSGSGSGGGRGDGSAPVPACASGDRQEFSGAVGSTGITVAVCSACGTSYVVASNGTGSAGQVSVANGSMTVTVNVPAGGMATSAKVADAPADGTVTVCAGTPQSCLPKTPNQKYCNPYRDLTSLVPERIDQGVDYGGAGPIYAMGPGTIDVFNNRTDSGWPGGTFVSYVLSAGPASGREIYLAENIDLNTSLQSGSFVYSGTVIGTLVDASPDSESGWGVSGESVTAEYGCYTEGCMTPLGVNFNTVLTCLGTPSGTMGTGGCCPDPAGWPSDWCTGITNWNH